MVRLDVLCTVFISFFLTVFELNGARVDASPFVYDCATWPDDLASPTRIFLDCSAEPTLNEATLPPTTFAESRLYIDVSSNNMYSTNLGTTGVVSVATDLRTLLAGGNKFKSRLPPDVGVLSKLRTLDLSQNQFEGELPPSWSGAVALRQIRLHGNANLTGSVPMEWSSMVLLEELDLRGTGMGGELPLELGALTRLHSLRLDGLNFTGCVPIGIPNYIPQMQASGYVLPYCTHSPTTAPSASPTSSVPSQAPIPLITVATMAPVSRPPTRSINDDDEETETLAPTTIAAEANSANIVVGVGLGIGIPAALILGLMWLRRTTRRPSAPAGELQSRDDERGGPRPSSPPPRPSGPQPVRPPGPPPNQKEPTTLTFTPSGWKEEAIGHPARQAAPPSDPKPQLTDSV